MLPVSYSSLITNHFLKKSPDSSLLTLTGDESLSALIVLQHVPVCVSTSVRHLDWMRVYLWTINALLPTSMVLALMKSDLCSSAHFNLTLVESTVRMRFNGYVVTA